MTLKQTGLTLVLFLAVFLGCLMVGRYPIAPERIAGLLLSGLGMDGGAASPQTDLIFWNIRVPRILLAMAAGAGISTAGAAFQALFRNPLAAPDILGVTAGSCFGAALAILCMAPAAWVVHASAFGFGILAVCLAYVLASASRDPSPVVLVISGIVISAVFQAGLSFLMYIANPYDQLARIIFWTMGSFNTASWDKLGVVLPVLAVGMGLMALVSWRLNLMTLSREEAMSMGMNILAWRIFFVLTATLMVASCVASVGTIAWVGLIVPHIARYLFGSDHRRLIPAAALLGAVFLMIMDTLARSILLSEVPISIVTSIFGAPFLGYLVVTAGKTRLLEER